MSGSRSRDGAAPLVSLGFSAGIAQAVLLREAMAASGGSELSWGAVLSLWLAAMALGAWVGVHRGTVGTARWGPALAVALAGVGVVLLRAAPAVAGTSPGEEVVAWRAVWVWAAAIAPGAFAGGWCFPALSEGLVGRGAAATAYALEGLGALMGGLAFTFVLAPLGSAAVITVAFGVVFGATVWLSGKRLPAFAVVVASLVAAVPAGGWLARAGWAWSGRIGHLAAWRDTHEQRLEVSSGPPHSLYADGRLVSTVPDPYRTEPLGHLAMLLHPAPRRVLAVGAAAEGSLPAMLAHRVERIEVVEEDRELPRFLAARLAGELRGALADPRVVVRREDTVTVVGGTEVWDLIVLRDGDPTTLRRNRTRTVEFFADCRQRLAPRGVLVVRVGVSDTYLGGPGGGLLATLASTLRSVFPSVVGIPGEEVMLVCGRDGEASVDVGVLTGRLAGSGVAAGSFAPALLPVLLDPDRARSLTRFLRTADAPLNTAANPRAVPPAAARVEGRGSPRLAAFVAGVARWPRAPLVWAVAAIVVGVLAGGWRGARLGSASACVVGAASMGWFLVLISAWQSRQGSTYEAIGALSAAFMAGLVAGSFGARRRGQDGDSWLPWVIAAGAAFSLVVAAGIMGRPSPAVVVPALALAGGLTGAAFPGLAWRISSGRPREGAGRGFAADEMGAAAAALVLGVVVIPWVGMSAAAGALAVVQVAAVVALWLSDRHRVG